MIFDLKSDLRSRYNFPLALSNTALTQSNSNKFISIHDNRSARMQVNIASTSRDSLLEKLKSNLQEVRARGGQLINFACTP